MTRENDHVSLDIEANVTAMIRRVAKKDTRSRARVKLVGGGGCLIREAQTTKGTKVIIPRLGVIKCLSWRAMV